MLEIIKERLDEAAVFHLSGRINLEKTAQLREMFWICLDQERVKKLIIDLAGVPSLDPSSVSLLVSTKNVVTKYRAELVLVGLNSGNYAMLEKTHLHFYFDIRANVAQALEEKPPAPTRERR